MNPDSSVYIIRENDTSQIKELSTKYPLFEEYCEKHCHQFPSVRHALWIDEKDGFIALLSQHYPFDPNNSVFAEILVVSKLQTLDKFLHFSRNFLIVSKRRLNSGIMFKNTQLHTRNQIQTADVLNILRSHAKK